MLARRPSGKIELVARGPELRLAARLRRRHRRLAGHRPASVSAPVDDRGRAQGTLDAPTTPGIYGVRVLVTDPRTGAISEARGMVVVR